MIVDKHLNYEMRSLSFRENLLGLFEINLYVTDI